jgi:hypothetical protein
MPWQPRERQEEWVQDEMVQEYRAHLVKWKAGEEKRLRTVARTGTLEEIRRVEARVGLLEEVINDFEDKEERNDG